MLRHTDTGGWLSRIIRPTSRLYVPSSGGVVNYWFSEDFTSGFSDDTALEGQSVQGGDVGGTWIDITTEADWGPHTYTTPALLGMDNSSYDKRVFFSPGSNPLDTDWGAGYTTIDNAAVARNSYIGICINSNDLYNVATDATYLFVGHRAITQGFPGAWFNGEGGSEPNANWTIVGPGGSFGKNSAFNVDLPYTASSREFAVTVWQGSDTTTMTFSISEDQYDALNTEAVGGGNIGIGFYRGISTDQAGIYTAEAGPVLAP